MKTKLYFIALVCSLLVQNLNGQTLKLLGPGSGGYLRAVYMYPNVNGNSDLYVGSDVSGVWRAKNIAPASIADPNQYNYEYISNNQLARFVNKFYKPASYLSNFLFVGNRNGIDRIDLTNYETPMLTILTKDTLGQPVSLEGSWVSDIIISKLDTTTNKHQVYFTTGNPRVSDKIKDNKKNSTASDFYWGTLNASEDEIVIEGSLNFQGLIGDRDVFCVYLKEGLLESKSDDQLYVGTERGLYVFNYQNLVTGNMPSQPVLGVDTAPTYKITSITKFDSTQFMITVYGKGLYLYNDTVWSNLSPNVTAKSAKGSKPYADKFFTNILPLKNANQTFGYVLLNEENLSTIDSNDYFVGAFYSPVTTSGNSILPNGNWVALDIYTNNNWGWNASKPAAIANGALLTSDNHLIMGRTGNIFITKDPISSVAPLATDWQQIYTKETLSNGNACSNLYTNQGYVNTGTKCVFLDNSDNIWMGQSDRLMWLSQDGGSNFIKVGKTFVNSPACSYINYTGASNDSSSQALTDCYTITENYVNPSDTIYAGVADGLGTAQGHGRIVQLVNANDKSWEPLGSSFLGNPMKMLFTKTEKYCVIRNNLTTEWRLFQLINDQWTLLTFNFPANINKQEIIDAEIDSSGNHLFLIRFYDKKVHHFTKNGSNWNFTSSVLLNTTNVIPQKLNLLHYNNGQSQYKVLCGTSPNDRSGAYDNFYEVYNSINPDTCTATVISDCNTGIFKTLNTDFLDGIDEGITAIRINKNLRTIYIATVAYNSQGTPATKSHLYKGNYNDSTGEINPNNSCWVEITGALPNKSIIDITVNRNSCHETLYAAIRGLSGYIIDLNTISFSSDSESELTCHGDSDGTATVFKPIGFNNPVSYLWSNGQTTATATGLMMGTYTVTVTNTNGCSVSKNKIIQQPNSIYISVSNSTAITCNGLSDGSSTAAATGGTGNYLYDWSNGQSTSTASNLTAGVYTVTVTDANGCSATQSITITEPETVTLTTSLTNAITCSGFSNGSAAATTTGGTGNYLYDWSNGQSTSTASNLIAGVYTVTVTDANGCSATQSITITEPETVTLTTSLTNAITCSGFSNGSAAATTTGGTGNYLYDWSNGQSTSTASNLTAGVYTVTVTDANGCSATQSITITEPETVTLTTSLTNAITCSGFSNGSATATTTGGTGNYLYDWSNGQTTSTANNLTAGVYTVTVTDANGCSATQSITLTEPETLTTSLAITSAITCNGFSNGSATATTTGGTGNYLYDWSNGQTTSTANNLTAGVYKVTVTDANGCSATQSITLTEPETVALTTSIASAITCNGFSNGSATATTTGGTGNYLYDWSNGHTTSTANNLTAGVYTVTVTDANGCSATQSITLTEPETLTTSLAITSAITCNGFSNGSATATTTGGTGNYLYDWSNGQTTSTASNLIAGVYTVTVTDANGCSATQSVTLTEPETLTTSLAITSAITCNGFSNGSATATTTGGTGSYLYDWSNGQSTSTASNLIAGVYTVTVTDANGCSATQSVTLTEPETVALATSLTNAITCSGFSNGSAAATTTGGTGNYLYDWSNGQTTSTASNLIAGVYTVTVTDANGCSATQSVTLTEPETVTTSLAITSAITCNGFSNGMATATTTGGTGNYLYDWSNGQTTSTASNLIAGVYTVTVTDANGCSATQSITLTEPETVTLTTTITNAITCNGFSNGSAAATTTGGTGSYLYDWSNGQTTSTASNLIAGVYTVTVTDANGCSATQSITITEPETVTLTTSLTNAITCSGFSNGSAAATTTGGTGNYLYDWSNGQSTSTASNLTAGVYTVTVTDANGCSATQSITITEPETVTLTTSLTNAITCSGFSNGSATATTTGGTGNYLYDWSNGQTTSTANNLTAGVYTVTVTDANGCSATQSITLTEPETLTTSLAITSAITCNGFSNGSATATTTGGTGNYLYDWSNGQTTSTANNLTAGVYKVTVTDANGCSATQSITLTEPETVALTTSIASAITCNGFSNGSATATTTGGTGNYLYDWSNGHTTSTANNLTAGVYTVTVTDANGCSATQSITLTEPETLTTSLAITSAITCNGFSNGSATATTTGGTGNYLYDWSNGQTTSTASNLIAGVYTVTVTDANGCSATQSVTLTEPETLTTSLAITSAITCNGFSNGSATATTTGGTGSYLYDWSNGQSTSTANNLTAGIYSVTVTDANGCTAIQIISILQPAPITSAVAKNNVSCNGGSNGFITVQIYGGLSPYSFVWNNGNTNSNIANLVKGTYIVTISDANGCSLSIATNISQPSKLTNSFINLISTCGLASATALPAGGSSPYTFLWSNGKSTASINNEASGVYTVYINDSKGCTVTGSVTLISNSLTTGITKINPSCFGYSNGYSGINILSSNGVCTYLWSNGLSTQQIGGLSAGTYTVTVTDATGCITTKSVNLSQPPKLSAVLVTTDVSCFEGNNGGVVVTANGGTPAYNYQWNDGSTIKNKSTLAIGSYTITITDSKGCTVSKKTTVKQPTPIKANLTKLNVTCFGGNNGSLTASPSGGIAPYTTLWSNGSNQMSANNLIAGTYTVTVSDFNGCTKTATNKILQSDAIIVSISSVGANLEATVSGGVASYSYLWNNGSTTATIGSLGSGITYTVTVTDANLCTKTASFNYIGARLISDFSKILQHFSIYPNPANNFVLIQFEANSDQVVHYELYDVYGKLILNGMVEATLGLYTLHVGLENYSNGIYVLKVTCDDQSIIQRLLIEK